MNWFKHYNADQITVEDTEVIEDRVFSKLYSADINKVIDFIKKCGVTGVRSSYSTVDKIIIPEIFITERIVYLNYKQCIELINQLDSKLGWELHQGAIGKGPIKNVFNKDLWITMGIPTIELLGNEDYRDKGFEMTFRLRPKKYDRDLIKKSPFLPVRYLYHVTDESLLPSIKRKGLIPTDESRTRFNHIKCLHLLRYLGGSIIKFDNFKLIVNPEMNIKRPILLKVGPLEAFNKYYFFIDPDAPFDGVVTPNSIPAHLISIVDPSDYKAEFIEASINQATKELEDKYFSELTKSPRYGETFWNN